MQAVLPLNARMPLSSRRSSRGCCTSVVTCTGTVAEQAVALIRQLQPQLHLHLSAACCRVMEEAIHRVKTDKAEVMVATHNQASVEHAVALMHELDLDPQRGVYFGQLLGMSDVLTYVLGAGECSAAPDFCRSCCDCSLRACQALFPKAIGDDS